MHVEDGCDEFSSAKLLSIFAGKLETFARLRERLLADEARHREQLAQKEQLQGKLVVCVQEHEKSLAAEKSAFTAQLEETRALYERKLEKLSSALCETRRQSEERAERILVLEQEKFLQGKGLAEAKTENVDVFESVKAQIDSAEGALRRLQTSQEGALADAARLRAALEEGINKVFTVEKELLSARRAEAKAAERARLVGEEAELVKFENENLLCLLEGKEGEARELRALLAENDKLLEKFRAKYAIATDKIEKALTIIHANIEKFPQPNSFETLRGELESLREENTELTKRNAYLEESLKLAMKQTQEIRAETPKPHFQRVDAAIADSFAEMLAMANTALAKIDVLSAELRGEKDERKKAFQIVDDLNEENERLKKALKNIERFQSETTVRKAPSQSENSQILCNICAFAVKKTDFANNCKKCRNTIHKKCFGKRYSNLICPKCAE